MDLLTLANTVYSIAKPIFTSEVGRKITADFKDAFTETAVELWEKISSLFIEVVDEEEKPKKAVKNLRANENDADAEKFIKGKIEEALYENDDLKAQIEAILAKQEAKAEVAKIINQTHSGSGDNVAGDKITNNTIKGDVKDSAKVAFRDFYEK
jgi:hypothetical protein